MCTGWRIILLNIGVLLLPIYCVYGQIACNPGLPPSFYEESLFNRPESVWTGHVFQFSNTYRPQNDPTRTFANNTFANRVWKGYLLRDGQDFLPVTGLNFDTQFSDYSQGGLDANSFFPTGTTPTETGGCATELRFFGVLMKSRMNVQTPGIYRVRIGSDDGSYFSMFDPISDDPVLDVNGNPVIHDNWLKTVFPFNYVYSENIRNYYVPFEGGEEIWMNLHYYEWRVKSRLSFNLELYFGPGEIAVERNGNSEGVYCGLMPNPLEFLSLGEAVFSEGTEPTYQWQYSLTSGAGATWIDIEGATGLTYKIPEYDENSPESYLGTRYFRRVASNVAVIVNEDGEEATQENSFSSNELQVSVQVIDELDVSEYGDNEWIGHIYRGSRNFDVNNYIGRHIESIEFSQTFMDVPYTGKNSQGDFHPDYGCPFFIDYFTVQYKMRYFAQAGTYEVRVRGDDGFRLSLDGGQSFIINSWNGGAARTITETFTVESDTELFMVLNYWEGSENQLIEFSFLNTITPVEWGQISGATCGYNNCLKWETIQEKNTSHFIMERSYDAREWVPISDSLPAQGNSTEPTHYGFTDDKFERARSYYRVKQVDLDGSIDYSEVIRVDHPNINRSAVPYPNPASEKIRFKTAVKVVQVKLISMDHRVNEVLDVASINGEGLYEVDISHLPKSPYLMSIVTEEGKMTYKILKRQ